MINTIEYWGLLNNGSWSSTCIIAEKKKRSRKNGQKTIFKEITDQNFPKLTKDTNLQVQELQPTSRRINTNKPKKPHMQAHPGHNSENQVQRPDLNDSQRKKDITHRELKYELQMTLKNNGDRDGMKCLKCQKEKKNLST